MPDKLQQPAGQKKPEKSQPTIPIDLEGTRREITRELTQKYEQVLKEEEAKIRGDYVWGNRVLGLALILLLPLVTIFGFKAFIERKNYIPDKRVERRCVSPSNLEIKAENFDIETGNLPETYITDIRHPNINYMIEPGTGEKDPLIFKRYELKPAKLEPAKTE